MDITITPASEPGPMHEYDMAEFESLKETNFKLEAEIKTLQDEIDSIKPPGKTKKLYNQLVNKKKALQDKEIELAKLQKKHTALSKEYKELQECNDSLQDENKNGQDQITKLQELIQQQGDKKNNRIGREEKEITTEKEGEGESYKDLLSKFEDLTKEYTVLHDTKEGLEASYTLLEEKCQIQLLDLQTAHNTIEELKKKELDVSESLKDAHTQKHRSEEENIRLQESMQQLQYQYDELNLTAEETRADQDKSDVRIFIINFAIQIF